MHDMNDLLSLASEQRHRPHCSSRMSADESAAAVSRPKVSTHMQQRSRACRALVWASILCVLICACVVAATSASSPRFGPDPVSSGGSSGSALPPHNNNWAVLVSTSRYWFNYRHTANALSMYHTVKRMGVPDSQIILMLPDEYACNARNPLSARVFHSAAHDLNLFPRDVEVDYRGTEVSVANFLRLLTGRHASDATPRSQRLLTDERSNILIYMTGHGGNNFLKFQDNEELNAQDLRDAFQQMRAQMRYRSILFMLDTCQAATLFWELNKEDTPDIITIGSSKIEENSYSVSVEDGLEVRCLDCFLLADAAWVSGSL